MTAESDFAVHARLKFVNTILGNESNSNEYQLLFDFQVVDDEANKVLVANKS